MKTPKAFASYSWDSDDHKAWVRNLAAKLRGHGVDVTLDRWAVAPGDQLPRFMETSVRENDFVLIILTPNYKLKSDGRTGGVGYEGDIMTGEVFAGKDARKFIPVLRSGTWTESSPSWLLGKYGVDLRGNPYSEDQYHDLLNTLHGTREQAPPIGSRPVRIGARQASATPPSSLHPQALAMLEEAARADGLIVAFESDDGLAIIAGSRRFYEPGNPRSDAVNRDILRGLIAAGLVERDSESTLRVTRQGFACIDSLEPGRVAVPSPPSQPGPIKITGIIVNEVGTPRNDGTPGSALYAVPFQLSGRPSDEWARHFVATWRNPQSYSSRHRPRIARVEGDRIILDGTTVEEVAEVHRDTLKVVIEKVNRDVEEWEQGQKRIAEDEAERQRRHTLGARVVRRRALVRHRTAGRGARSVHPAGAVRRSPPAVAREDAGPGDPTWVRGDEPGAQAAVRVGNMTASADRELHPGPTSDPFGGSRSDCRAGHEPPEEASFLLR